MFNVKQGKVTRAGYVDVPTGPEGYLSEAVPGDDVLLPAQFYGARRGSAAVEPVKRLMMAILGDAIRCYQRNLAAVTLRKRREFREAQDWLFKDRDDGLFSFDTVCYVLETDPDLLRQRLIQFQNARGATVRRESTIGRRYLETRALAAIESNLSVS